MMRPDKLLGNWTQTAGLPALDFPEPPPHIWVRVSDDRRIKRRLRISLTDNCNFRCFFCHNEGQGPLSKRARLQLTPPEIEPVIRVALKEGVSKIKLTGGEPLLYRSGEDDIVGLVQKISSLRDEGHIFDLSLTTNGSLMPQFAAALRRAGLDRVTVSLTTLDRATFQSLISGNVKLLRQSLIGLRAACSAGLAPLKVNMPLYYSARRDLGNLTELHDILEVAKECGVQEMRLFTLLWHQNFEQFDEFYHFFSPKVSQELEKLFERHGVVTPHETVNVLSNLATIFADRVYPKVEFGIDLGELKLGFEAMKFGRLPMPAGLQEGPYAMRMAADGALRPTLQGPKSYSLINGIRAGLDAEGLRYLYRKELEEMP